MDELFSAALALLLRTLPYLSGKIQAAVAVHQPGLIACEFTNHATAQQGHRNQAADQGSCGARCSTCLSVADPEAADWSGWRARQSAAPVLAVVA